MFSIEDFKQFVSGCEQLDPSFSNAYEKAFLNYCKLKEQAIIRYKIPEGLHLFRARIHKKDVLYKRVDQIGAPPPICVQSFARCNRPYQSIFYCSDSRPTVHLELLENISETTEDGEKVYVTIGSWILKKPLKVIIVSDPDVSEKSINFDKLHGSVVKDFINKLSEEKKVPYTLFYKFLTEKFRKPAKNDIQTYLITSAYFNLVSVIRPGHINGISYPSVSFQGEGVNYAITPEFVRDIDNIELTFAIRDEFVCFKKEKNKPTFLQTELIECKQIENSKNRITW